MKFKKATKPVVEALYAIDDSEPVEIEEPKPKQKKRKAVEAEDEIEPVSDSREEHRESQAEKHKREVKTCPYRILSVADIENDNCYGVSCPITVQFGYRPGTYLGFFGDQLKQVVRRTTEYPCARYMLGTLTDRHRRLFPPHSNFLIRSEEYESSNFYIMCSNWRGPKLVREAKKMQFHFQPITKAAKKVLAKMKKPAPKKVGKFTFAKAKPKQKTLKLSFKKKGKK